MKKALIASTALALSAGVAAAEVKFGGDARMGLQYNSGAAAGLPTTTLEKRMTLNIDGSTTSDGGVTFGARVRIRSDEVAGTGVSGARVFASMGGLTVAAGNINGAIESMPNLYAPSVGLTGLGWGGLVTNVSQVTSGDRHFDWDAFSSRGNGAEGIEAIYSMGDFTVHISHSSNGLRGAAGDTQRTGIYGAYTFSGWTIALGIQDSTIGGAVGDAANIEDKIVATVGGNIGDFSVGLGYASNGAGVNKIDKFALNGVARFGATTVTAYVASQNFTPTGIVNPKRETYGLGVIYALGGGASLQAGIESTTANTTRADLGVSFRF